jgi:hypothetical protein
MDHTVEEKFDVRTIEHKLRRGVITQAQYEAFLAQLPDDAAHGIETTTRFATGHGGFEGSSGGDD